MTEPRTPHDPHPLAPDEPGIPGQEEYGLGDRRISAIYGILLWKAGHIKEVPAEVFIDARLSRQAVVALRRHR